MTWFLIIDKESTPYHRWGIMSLSIKNSYVVHETCVKITEWGGLFDLKEVRGPLYGALGNKLSAPLKPLTAILLWYKRVLHEALNFSPHARSLQEFQHTDNTIFPFPFKLNGIWSWRLVSLGIRRAQLRAPLRPPYITALSYWGD